MSSNFMSITIRLALLISLIGVWLMATPRPTHACSCRSIGSPSKELAEAHVVFMGKAISISENPGAELYSDILTTEFHVDTVWKGPANPTIHINSGPHFDSCGFPFTEGEEYIVYAYYSDWSDGLATSYCSRTTSLRLAKNDLAELGHGREPPVAGMCGPSSRTPDLMLTGLLVLAGLAWLGLQKRKLG